MADSTSVSSENSSKVSNIDVTKLTPLSPEVISKQATINIGTIGHVAHGKSTVVKALSGVQTVRFKNELERNITIKLDQEKGVDEVHSTVVDSDEDDEDALVLAEIGDIPTLKQNNATKSPVKEDKFLNSPSRVSVIQHTESDSPVKKDLSKEFDAMEDHIPSTPESVDSDKVKAVAKKKPGPKSRTQVIEERSVSDVKRKPGPKSRTQPLENGSDSEMKDTEEAELETKKKPGPKSRTQPLEDRSETEVKKKPGPKSRTQPSMEDESEVKRKPGPKSKTQPLGDGPESETRKIPGPKSKTQTSEDESESEVQKKPGPKSKTQSNIRDYLKPVTPEEPKRKPGPKSKTQFVDSEEKKNNSESEVSKEDDSEHKKKKKIGPKSKTHPKRVIFESGESDSDFESTKKSVRSKTPDSDNDSGDDGKKMDVDSEPEDDNRFKAPTTRGSVANDIKEKTRNLRTKKERKFNRHHDSDDEESQPPAKKQRSTSTDSTSNEKKKRTSKVDNSYRSRRRSSKKRRPSTSSSHVNRDTPSETRVIEDTSSIDFTVGRQDDGEYEVETVIDARVSEGRQYYKIKWKGWPASFNTWEPMEFLVHSQESLLEFFQNEPNRCQERLVAIGREVPQLVPLPGKFADYERDVVLDLKKEELENINVFKEDYTAILPSYKLLCSHITKFKKNFDSELEKKIRSMIAIREKIRLRYDQLKLLKEWETDMIEKSKDEASIIVENTEDLEGPPLNFHFRSANVPGEGVEIPDDPFVGCDCRECGDTSKCCSAQSGSKFAYTSDGLLKVEHGTPVYECNKRCTCNADCSNRVVQKGRLVELKIFRTPNKIGWGVRITEDVPQGKFICEYVGEVVKKDIADDRIKSEYKGRPLYIFDLDFNDAKEFPYTVDAYQYGNISHFINHSCEPNLAVYAVWIDCLDPNLPRLAMFAIRDIKKGEELTFDYSAQYHRKRKSHASKKDLMNRRSDKTPCKCGSSMCRQVLF